MTALEFFQRENIQWLPVDPMQVIRNEKIKALEYTEFSRIIQEPIPVIIDEYGEDGFSTIVNGSYTIIYSRAHTTARIRWTLMHELAHIMLGHLDECGGIAARSAKKDKYDIQADFFTVNVLAPLPVLYLCKADSVTAIKYISGLSTQAASIRLSELQQSHFKERDLSDYANQFFDYIESKDFLTDMEFDDDAYKILKYRKCIEPERRCKRNRIPIIPPARLMELGNK